MANLLALRTSARKKSGVSATDYSNSDLYAEFNQAYYTLAGLLANLEEDFFEEQRVRFNLVGNSGLYSLPQDCIAVKQLRLAYSTPSTDADYRIATPYDQTDVHDISIDEVNTPITNPIYDIVGNYYRIFPKPATSVTDGGKLSYIAMPSALVNTGDTPVIPLQYHDLLSDYGAAQMEFKYEKWKKYDRHMLKWNEKIAELTQILADRDRNKPVRMKSPLEIPAQLRNNRRELPGNR